MHVDNTLGAVQISEIYAALNEADLFVAIGTSSSVYPAAGFVSEARALGIRTCEFNLEPSDNAEQFDERRYGLASEAVPTCGESFRTYVDQVLAPTLKPGDVVILDNLGSHKGKAVRRAIRASGARLLFLPPYSPDLNPIEQVFAKLKHLMRKAKERTVDALPGNAPAHCSKPSNPANAKTTSSMQATLHPKMIMLRDQV